MSERKESTRSLSRDLEDSDQEDHDEGSPSQAPGKPGRKKNPNSQAARRDQNRIAQREFRLRKQQRIRDLEARVELLSGNQDEALTDLRGILKDLMAENHTLRGLLKSVAGFIGEGAGGLLPRLGWDIADFNTLINKTETDTAWEAFQTRRTHLKNGASSADSPANGAGATSSMVGPSPPATGTAPSNTGLKRPSEDDTARQSKKSRSMSDAGDGDYPLLVPPMSAAGMYPPPPGRSPDNGLFSDLMRNTSSPMFMSQNGGNGVVSQSSPATSGQYGTPPNGAGYSGYMQPTMSISDNGLPAMNNYGSKNNGVTSTSQQASARRTSNEEPDDNTETLHDPKKVEAWKLIMYHLENYMRNNAYCLPSSLRPTLVQRTINHESAIDKILHPELRDRIILLRGQFSLPDCMFDYKKAITVHSDDVLAHANWEIDEWWLRKYAFLVEKNTLAICNRWRVERNESEISLTDLGAQEGPS